VRAFTDDLSVLDSQIVKMGGLAEALLGDAFDALASSDGQLARDVVRRDVLIDEIESDVEERVYAIIARRQPMAVDLRQIIAALQISNELERVGDLSKNIAKRTQDILGKDLDPRLLTGLRNMTTGALTQLHEVMDAYADRDATAALRVWRDDDTLDATYNSVFADLIAHMTHDAPDVGLYTHLMFGAKNIERVGDHTTNIAENVFFLVTGNRLESDRPKRNCVTIPR